MATFHSHEQIRLFSAANNAENRKGREVANPANTDATERVPPSFSLFLPVSHLSSLVTPFPSGAQIFLIILAIAFALRRRFCYNFQQ